jgi:hypothetical protein
VNRPGRSHSSAAAEVWSDPEFAAAWLSADPVGARDLLALPRGIAAALVAYELPHPRLVVDVASGAGAFLSVLLDAFPEARGVWTDASPAMLEKARVALDRCSATGSSSCSATWQSCRRPACRPARTC